MAYELFRISGSPFAWRASLALMIKGLDYEDRLLDAGKREHKEPWYLALNPRGKVPVLKDGDTVVCESAAIMAYLDARHPEPPLFGKSAGQSARIAQLASEILNYLAPALLGVVRPIFSGKFAAQADEMKDAASRVHAELALYETILGQSNYLAGDEISAADATLFPTVQQILRAGNNQPEVMEGLGFIPFDQHFANISAWIKRIEAMPGYDKTYPPHWR